MVRGHADGLSSLFSSHVSFFFLASGSGGQPHESLNEIVPPVGRHKWGGCSLAFDLKMYLTPYVVYVQRGEKKCRPAKIWVWCVRGRAKSTAPRSSRGTSTETAVEFSVCHTKQTDKETACYHDRKADEGAHNYCADGDNVIKEPATNPTFRDQRDKSIFVVDAFS